MLGKFLEIGGLLAIFGYHFLEKQAVEHTQLVITVDDIDSQFVVDTFEESTESCINGVALVLYSACNERQTSGLKLAFLCHPLIPFAHEGIVVEPYISAIAEFGIDVRRRKG